MLSLIPYLSKLGPDLLDPRTTARAIVNRLQQPAFAGKRLGGLLLDQSAAAGMGNYLVGIFKDTPMLSVIGVAELMHTANAIGSEYYRYLEPYTLVGLIFLAISLPTAFGIRSFEVWLRRSLGMGKD